MDNDKLLALSKGLGQALQARKLMLAVAESCTGGMLAQYVTAIAGSSVGLNVGLSLIATLPNKKCWGLTRKR